MERLAVPQGEFVLARHPVRSKDPLRPWDAADEYLLRHVASGVDLAPGAAVVIGNDGFGALSVALAPWRPALLSDSWVAQEGMRRNLARNGLEPGSVTVLDGLAPAPPPVDVLLVKVPKSLALLEDQLLRLRPSLHAGTVVVGAAMAKHVHSSTIEVFERVVGPTRTSLAEKKARLLFAGVDPSLDPGPSPWPTSYRTDAGREVTSHAGVFSADHLDIGTRFFLDALAAAAPDPAGPDVVDLGCGNGVIGMQWALDHPDARVTFVDESHRAVASADVTFHANLGPHRAARFVVHDGLAGVTEPTADGTGEAGVFDGQDRPAGTDLVLNNPPFHVDHALGDAVAWQMFTEAHAALRPGGELWVVGNRHLAYHAKLKRIFGNCDVMASNAKFVVVRAVRARGR